MCLLAASVLAGFACGGRCGGERFSCGGERFSCGGEHFCGGERFSCGAAAGWAAAAAASSASCSFTFLRRSQLAARPAASSHCLASFRVAFSSAARQHAVSRVDSNGQPVF